MDSKPRASSVCSLEDAPDAWRGYLGEAEIAARLAAIVFALREQDRSPLAERVAEICRGLPESEAAASVPDTAAAFDQLLPRIRDDRLHAALKGIRDAL